MTTIQSMEFFTVKLTNELIHFKIAGEEFKVKRIFIKQKFPNIYWFAGRLEEDINALFLENPDWFKKHNTK